MNRERERERARWEGTGRDGPNEGRTTITLSKEAVKRRRPLDIFSREVKMTTVRSVGRTQWSDRVERIIPAESISEQRQTDGRRAGRGRAKEVRTNLRTVSLPPPRRGRLNRLQPDQIEIPSKWSLETADEMDSHQCRFEFSRSQPFLLSLPPPKSLFRVKIGAAANRTFVECMHSRRGAGQSLLARYF